MNRPQPRGFIGAGLLIVIGLLILQFGLDVNIFGWLKSPEVSNVLLYLKKFFLLLWNNIIKAPVVFLWNELVIDIIWKYTLVLWGWLTGWVDSNS
jgi:hypothetical protein